MADDLGVQGLGHWERGSGGRRVLDGWTGENDLPEGFVASLVHESILEAEMEVGRHFVVFGVGRLRDKDKCLLVFDGADIDQDFAARIGAGD